MKEKESVFEQEVSVTLRSWLPLRTEVPSQDMFQALSGEIDPTKVDEIVEQFKLRVESMWIPDLPGIDIFDIAVHFAEYLGFRAVERWAKQSGSRSH